MLKKVIAALGLAGAALVSVALPASAQTQAAPNCQFGSSYGVVEGSAPVTPITGGAAVGSAQVCRDSNYDYWGFAIYSSPMTVSQWAQVYLNRYRDGILVDTITCDTPGGNDRIGPGQTRCWTPKLTGLSGRWTFQTYSEKYSSHTGSLLAAGHTAIVR